MPLLHARWAAAAAVLLLALWAGAQLATADDAIAAGTPAADSAAPDECSLDSLGLADLGDLLAPEQAAALQAACRAVLRLPPADQAALAAEADAAAAPFLAALLDAVPAVVLAALEEAAAPAGKPGSRGWTAAGIDRL